jgi:hypothetical protein
VNIYGRRAYLGKNRVVIVKEANNGIMQLGTQSQGMGVSVKKKKTMIPIRRSNGGKLNIWKRKNTLMMKGEPHEETNHKELVI